MKLINRLVVVCCAIVLVACGGNSNEYLLTGKLLNCKSNTAVINYGTSADDASNLMDTISINNDGTFEYKRKLDAPAIAFMMVEEQGFFQLILINGTKNRIEADLSKLGDYKITGDLEKAYDYYTKVSRRRNSLSEAEYGSFKELETAMNNITDSIHNTVKEVGNDSFSQLIANEMKRGNELSMLLYCQTLNEKGMSLSSDSDYNKYMQEFPNIGTKANLRSGLLNIYISWHTEYYKENGGKAPFQYMLDLAKEKISDPDVLQKEYRSIMSDFFASSDEYGELEDFYNKALSLLDSDETKKDMTERYEIFKKVRPGAQGIECELKDQEGKTVKFSELFGKGKAIYIDVWATWCGPCCAEISYVEKLVEKFKNNPKIEFVSISTDNDIDAWKKKLEADKPQWKQFLNENFYQLYNINGIPRFMMFDKNGKIITIDAPRPSDPDIEKFILDNVK